MKSLFVLIIFLTGCASSAPNVVKPGATPVVAKPIPIPPTSTEDSCYSRVETAKSWAVNSDSVPRINDAISFCIGKINRDKNKSLYEKLSHQCEGDYKMQDPDAASVLVSNCKLNAIEFVKSLPEETFSSFGYKYVPPVSDDDGD
jgi:hypothetical protein